ncbi:MAG TPA: DUF4382 domain-containing protein [Terriglobales bacterium]|nr:DUF4382 domain-containing protein [Terriglobales bacterium]
MKRFVLLTALLALIALTFTACGDSSSSSPSQSGSTPQYQAFVTGEDAPVPSVISFYITINSITVSNSSSTVTLLSQPTTVDFGRLMGLRSLLGFNKVAAGSYTSATFTLASPVIYYVDMTTTPPSVGKINGTLTNSTVTVAFPNGSPLTVSSNGQAGLHMDFDLRQSLAVDNNGQITGSVNPTIEVMAVSASSELGQITEFTGSVVSTSSAENTFTMQGPYGFQEVIDVSSVSPQTLFNGSYTLGSLPTNAIVSVVGTFQADGSIMASDVEVITTDKAFISGRILAVAPGPVVTMFVGEELPDLSPTIPIDTVYTVNLSAVTQYDVCFIDNWLTGQFFNNSTLVVGQRIFVGGSFQNATFTPDLVSLRRQGILGSLVANSVSINSGNQGSFEMQNDLLMSYSAGGPFTVYTGEPTIFENINGLAGLQSAGAANLVTRGLVFKDLNTQKPIVVAGRVRVLP